MADCRGVQVVDVVGGGDGGIGVTVCREFVRVWLQQEAVGSSLVVAEIEGGSEKACNREAEICSWRLVFA